MALINLVLVAISATASGMTFYFLWRKYPLYGFAASSFLLLGGASFFSPKNSHLHAIFIGLGIGAFIGSLGATSLLHGGK